MLADILFSWIDAGTGKSVPPLDAGAVLRFVLKLAIQ
jgi:hypothetical protein